MRTADADRALANAREDGDFLLAVVQQTTEVKRVSGRLMCLCPAHAERTPSCHVRQDKACWYCFGCGEGGTVVDWLIHAEGLTLRGAIERAVELHGGAALPRLRVPEAPPTRPAKVFPSPEAAYPNAAAIFDYEALRVVRLEHEGGKKEFRQMRRVDGGWTFGKPEGLSPLYRRKAWEGHTGVLWVVEGEKCVEALESVGCAATTAAGGSNAPQRSDWSPVLNRDLVLWPDADTPGRDYIRWVVRYLRAKRSTGRVWRIEPEKLDLVDGQDAFDWFLREGGSREALVMAARSAVPVQVRYQELEGGESGAALAV